MRSLKDVLSDTLFSNGLAVFILAQALLYFGIPRLLPSVFPAVKQRGWILTAANSLVSLIVSSVYLYTFATSRSLLLSEHAFHAWHTVNTLFCAWFVSYLVADLVLGTFLYPSQMGRWTGYFHHTLYLILIPYTMMIDVSANFVLMTFLELPTLHLSLAQIHKPLRHDLLFGFTYFVTRILLHAYLILEFVWGYPSSSVWVLPAGVFPLHLLWFGQWCRQQRRLRNDEKKHASTKRKTALSSQVALSVSTTEGKKTKNHIDDTLLRELVESHLKYKDIPAVYLGKKRIPAMRNRGESKRHSKSTQKV